MSMFPPYRLPVAPPPPHPPPPAPPPQMPTSITSVEEQAAGPAEGTVATLLVRHLPEAITHEMLSRLFSHYGASSVRPCAGGRLRNCAFVDFKDEGLASQAQSQLNRLRFLGNVLTVEPAGKINLRSTLQENEVKHAKDLYGPPDSLSKDSVNNISSRLEPISARLGVDYPFPPHLEYVYPPPDGNILTNIVNALIAVPQFYTQVLHLMNKMNIPAPFRMALPTPPLPPSVPAPSPPPPPPITAKPHTADLSSDESELESSEDDADGHCRKRAKRESIVGPAVDKDVSHEAVGLKPATLVPKEVPLIKKKNPVLQIKISSKTNQKESKDIDSSAKELLEPKEENADQKPYATQQEIKSKKLPPEEILSLPMFKNYAAGNPANVLYIKNLAKDVVVDDFHFIFGSLFKSAEGARSSLSVKLMQEGRMRGQAFVTFPSVDLAHNALNLANGYVFKGKPMIIQFGRNPSSGKTG
ncbi:U11/U12 small nuclear ribonucleoprotein 65 kDa protein [Dioscorea cayenensis subsp. rotundata]|uniref:U11/U12 small nuclear ribonucleoprotein 65 kDa protein n=1 Tax=Dioscorea cayennensis subsp. rotundata TaxID=55577 RepID=A0AB40BKV3_DIOCR|nr:U11/U12 small nuclear ribonucleoprotein 65 kDa protein [Dioscorea cayenensis subsp. rotundata]